MRNKALVVAFAALLAGACQSATERTPPHTLLWVPASVAPLEAPRSFEDGSASVVIEVDNVDPDLLTSQLIEHYFSTRWAARTRIDSEWRVFAGGGVIPTDAQGRPIKRQTKYWHAEWEDRGGNLIKYSLKESRIPGESGSTINIYGSYIPAALVRR